MQPRHQRKEGIARREDAGERTRTADDEQASDPPLDELARSLFERSLERCGEWGIGHEIDDALLPRHRTFLHGDRTRTDGQRQNGAQVLERDDPDEPIGIDDGQVSMSAIDELLECIECRCFGRYCRRGRCHPVLDAVHAASDTSHGVRRASRVSLLDLASMSSK